MMEDLEPWLALRRVVKRDHEFSRRRAGFARRETSQVRVMEAVG